MPPKKATASASGAGGSTINRASASSRKNRPEPQDDELQNDSLDEEDNTHKSIPPKLLTRLLHEFFAKDGTRITKDANAAVAKYMEIFVREAIARSVAERETGGFLDVEDLERIAPQLLMDM